MSYVKRVGCRKPKSGRLAKFDLDLPAMELERARLFAEFGEGWVREYWRRHPADYFQPGEKKR